MAVFEYLDHFLRAVKNWQQHWVWLQSGQTTKNSTGRNINQTFQGCVIFVSTEKFSIQLQAAWHLTSNRSTVNYFLLSSWAGVFLQILQSDWFRERAVFSPSGPLTAGGIRSFAWWDYISVSKFSWKPFKSPFNIITQINMFWWNLSLSFALPLFSLPSTRP